MSFINVSLTSILFTSLFFYSCSTEQQGSSIREKLKPCNLSGLDSSILCGTYSVFENRQTNAGRKIDLKIIVIPAIHKNNSNAPIFWLEGGPGVPVTNSVPFYADSINYYRLEHDIVLLDTRGTGGSNPLHCRQLQYKRNLEEQFQEMYPRQAVKDCYDSLSKLADLTQYTSTNMAMDMEEVRAWLGYDKINLYGLSGGGRLAQVYMKMFPNSVKSCVLWSPATTYMKQPLYHAQYSEESINRLFDDCKSDPKCNGAFPTIKEEFSELMKQGNAAPFKFTFKDDSEVSHDLTIPWYSFQTKIRGLMYSPMGLRQVPYIIHQSYLGNWQPFVSLFPSKSSFDDFLAEGLYLCITCTEDVPFITSKEVDSLTRGTFVGKYRVEQQIAACANWTKGTVPNDFFEPVRSEIPTLVFSGYYDPVTAPSMVEPIVESLPKGVLISIPTMSHMFDGLSNQDCFDKIVVDFFSHPIAQPNTDCIAQMLPGDFKVN